MPDKEIGYLATLLALQPETVQILAQYLMAMLLVEMGLAKIVGTQAGEAGPRCTIRFKTGNFLTVTRPPLDELEEVIMIARLRRILEEEGE